MTSMFGRPDPMDPIFEDACLHEAGHWLAARHLGRRVQRVIVDERGNGEVLCAAPMLSERDVQDAMFFYEAGSATWRHWHLRSDLHAPGAAADADVVFRLSEKLAELTGGDAFQMRRDVRKRADQWVSANARRIRTLAMTLAANRELNEGEARSAMVAAGLGQVWHRPLADRRNPPPPIVQAFRPILLSPLVRRGQWPTFAADERGRWAATRALGRLR